jgi:translation elongation factor EF-1beta
MNPDELISELLQALTNDVQSIQKQVAKLPTQPPADYRVNLDKLTQAVQELGQQSAKPAAAAVDLSAITAQLGRIEQQGYQRPEYKMSRAVQIGSFAFGLMAILLGLMTYYGWSWKGERDHYQQAYEHDNWRVRYTEQANPDYYSFMEAKFKDDSDVYKWIADQEEADQKRELAQKASEQAKALANQAKRLENGAATKGDKKGRR